ncbi:MAG: twin-arginine translocation signal domain-containing protein, partial [Rhodocyclaceae bacterium]|nr:twin-arginine translocation signal domain-containing protein [Rhodocyclaceae bacterium]
MLIKRPDDIRPSEITPPAVYADRRRFLQLTGAGAAALALGQPGALFAAPGGLPGPIAKSPLSTLEEPTSRKDVVSYNNYYEFGTDKR